MKHPVMILLLVCLSCMAEAQTEGKAILHGFKEPVAPGAAPGMNIDEEGRQTASENKQAFNYLVYLETESRVYPSEIWINGKAYGASVKTVATPVSRPDQNNPGSEKLLVPKTSKNVIQLTPVTAVPDKLSEKGRELASSNELVVVYKQQGRFYYQALPAFKLLETIATQ